MIPFRNTLVCNTCYYFSEIKKGDMSWTISPLFSKFIFKLEDV